MPPIIWFSHRYLKMPEGYERSKLIDVTPINLKDMSPEFREYDTAIVGGGHYPLPKSGKYLILKLLSGKGHEWTTVRSKRGQYGDKEAYYRSLIGQVFDCVIKEVV